MEGIHKEVRAASATSCNPNGNAAIEEACTSALNSAQLQNADWAFLFAGVHYGKKYQEMLHQCHDLLGTENVVGCSALGILTEAGEIEGPPALALLAGSSPQLEFEPFMIHDLNRGSAKIAEEILLKLPGNASTVVLFPDIFQLDAEEFFEVFNEFNRNRNIPLQIVGGAPSSEYPNHGTMQFAGREITQGGISGVFLKGTLPCRVGVTQACQLVTESFEITACEGQWITELDGRPSFQVLREQIPEPLIQDDNRFLKTILLAIPADEKLPLSNENFVARNICGVDANNHVIACSDNIRKGLKIAFALRNGDGARDHLKNVLHSMKKNFQDSPPHFGIYFNCCARGKKLYGFQDIDTSYITNEFNSFPLIGLSSFAEIGPVSQKSFLQAYTGVLMLA